MNLPRIFKHEEIKKKRKHFYKNVYTPVNVGAKMSPDSHCRVSINCYTLLVNMILVVAKEIVLLREEWGTFFLPRAIWIFTTSFPGHTKSST